MTLKYVLNIMEQIMKALIQSRPQGLTSDVLNDYIHPPKPFGLKLFFPFILLLLHLSVFAEV